MRTWRIALLVACLVAVALPVAAHAFVWTWAPVEASSRFTWLTPAPQGNDLVAVDFVSDIAGWAVGANGTVLKTADGGFTWTQQGPIAPQGAEDVVHNMTDVCFTDLTHGWATGGNRVWRTTNGGTTWGDCTPEFYDPASSLPIMWRSVSFSDANNGWVVGRDRIYRTTNGGTSWTRQTNPTGEALSRVEAADSATAFVSGYFEGYLYTASAGVSWQAETFDDTAHEGHWADAIAVASGSTVYAAAGGDVLKTTDSGSTWTTMTVGYVDGDGVAEVCTVQGTGGASAWAFTDSGTVYRTTDGGATDWSAGGNVSPYASSPDAPSASAIYITDGQVECSTDGGTSFGSRSQSFAGSAFSGLAFLDDKHGFAVGGGDLIETEDGGSTWSHADISGLGVIASDIDFAASDPMTGWIVGAPDAGGRSVLKTVDGGQTWESQPETDMAAARASFPDTATGWAVTNGNWGYFWRTTDGGASWSKVERDGYFWDVDFASPAAGWIALDLDDGVNRILATSDGGSTWTTQTVGTSGGHVVGLDFVDSAYGWCADSFGNLYRTTNGGTSWTWLSHSPGAQVDVTDIKFASRTEGWVVGEQWTTSVLSSYRHDFAAHTTDGGVTWDYRVNPEDTDEGSTGSAVHLKAVDAVAGHRCWVAGGSAVLAGRSMGPTAISVTSASKTLSAYGATYILSGTLTSEGKGLAGRQVVLQSAPAASGPWADTSVKRTTASNGSFSLPATPRSKTYYRARFAGSGVELAAATSSYRTALPRAYVSRPYAPSTMKRGRSATIYGYLKPKHTSGSYPVRIYRWRYIGGGKWKSYGYVKAKASTYSSTTSKYAKSFSLPYKGKWRLRAYHPADSGHASSWSSTYDYVTVK